MKIRKKIKRAIVSFFKDELLEWVREEEDQLKVILPGDLKLVKLEHDIDLETVNNPYCTDGRNFYQQIISDIEKEFVDSILKLTKTEMIRVHDHGLCGITKVRFSLYIAYPKEGN